MHPVRFRDLLESIAISTAQPVPVVSDVLNIYYTLVRDQLTGLTHNRVQVANLGTFSIKVETTRKKLQKLQRTTVPSETIRQEIGQLSAVLQLTELEKSRKTLIRQKRRNHHVTIQEPHSYLEDTQPDLGRDQQLDLQATGC